MPTDYVPWDQTKLLIDLSAVDRPEMKALAETTRPLAAKLVWLNASHHQWPAEFFELLPAFSELQRLHLAGTGVTDQDLLVLLNLTQLDYLNLNETAVTVEGVAMLASRLPALRRVNLFGTGLTSESVEQLRRAFPNVAFVGVP